MLKFQYQIKIVKKQLISVFCPLAIICNMAQPGLTQDTVPNGSPIGTITSGETIYFEPNHIPLPEPEFYTGNWEQWPSTIDKLISIKHTTFERQGNEVFYDALLSDKQDGFQEISRFKVICSPSDNSWPNIKIYFFLLGYKQQYSEEWKLHNSWPNITPEWKSDTSNPKSSGEQWLFVNLAENACLLTE